MLHDPPVLILDEPTNGLDPTQIRAARALVRELGHDRTLLVCSHILAEVERTCDRVIVIAGGRVRADGSPNDLVALAAGGSPCIVECRASPRVNPESLIKSVSGVHTLTCETHKGWVHARATPAPGAETLAESIGRALAGAGVEIRRLETERPTLEAVFMHAIETDADERREARP